MSKVSCFTEYRKDRASGNEATEKLTDCGVQCLGCIGDIDLELNGREVKAHLKHSQEQVLQA